MTIIGQTRRPIFASPSSHQCDPPRSSGDHPSRYPSWDSAPLPGHTPSRPLPSTRAPGRRRRYHQPVTPVPPPSHRATTSAGDAWCWWASSHHRDERWDLSENRPSTAPPPSLSFPSPTPPSQDTTTTVPRVSCRQNSTAAPVAATTTGCATQSTVRFRCDTLPGVDHSSR